MRNITLGFPEELYSHAQNTAFERGVSLSEIIRLSVAKECGFYGYSSIKWGGDRSSSKTKDTHASVCARMRAAKAEKRNEDMRRIMESLDKKRARKSEASSDAA